MKWFSAALLAIVILLVAALFRIPASTVPYAIAELESRGLLPADAPKLTLTDTEGTLWQGRANSAVLTIDGVPVDLGKLEWQLEMASLFRRHPQLALRSHSEKIQAAANVAIAATGEVAVNNFEGRLPIAVLEPWFPMLVTGDIAFVIDHVVFNTRQLLALDGLLNFEYVDWVGADHNMSLGSYMARLQLADDHDLIVTINDFAALLGIQGEFRVDRMGNYHFNALLQAREGLASEVAQSITWLGRRDSEGSIVIDKRGRL